ncbi:hypothetical protein BDV95DRAFT_177445 [Massariosphaeria phaeospora]|uniref:Uncharacterized protein n=1 Tax=Massariosphaeria phaeospora TaxID=100035 RepID=A0A7C8M1R2_9PLEO|nr:hypothetical protein BDV95DRAFT_177445 [Massariosphaeria phaeospora]
MIVSVPLLRCSGKFDVAASSQSSRIAHNSVERCIEAPGTLPYHVLMRPKRHAIMLGIRACRTAQGQATRCNPLWVAMPPTPTDSEVINCFFGFLDRRRLIGHRLVLFGTCPRGARIYSHRLESGIPSCHLQHIRPGRSFARISALAFITCRHAMDSEQHLALFTRCRSCQTRTQNRGGASHEAATGRLAAMTPLNVLL